MAAGLTTPISRAIDVLLAFPGILLAIALVAVLGPSLTNVVMALSVIGWVGYARLVRGQVLKARELEFVQAARALGAGTPRILLRHVVPTTMHGRDGAGDAWNGRRHLAEASLSFLGLGVQPPNAKLGDDAQRWQAASARRAASHDLFPAGDCRPGARIQLPWAMD
jgi:ABC-type dipeptide/oligopeptide/nickel transport system permease subunit